MAFDTSLALSIQAARNINVGRGSNTGGGASAPSDFQLAAGHYLPEEFGMVAVLPRPDSETGTFTGNFSTDAVSARYRWAYYDGVNPVRYEVALKIFGGSAPHIFELISGPAGMSVGTQRDAANHGVVKWTPDQSYPFDSPASVTVRVYGQDGNTLDLSWTIQTTSSTDKFMFADADSGNDTTGDGSISNPFQTLAKFTGADSTAVTYPNRIVYLRGATANYATVAHSDSWMPTAQDTIPARIQLVKANHPYSYIAFPDESVAVDWSGAQILTDSADDFFFGGSSGADLRILGSANNAAETHSIWIGPGRRGHLQWINFVGFIARTNGNFTNSRPIFSPSGDYTQRQYWSCHAVKESERTSVVVNDGMLWCLFHMQYWADDYCSGSRQGGPGVAFKDNCYNTSSRYLDISTDSESTFAFMGQNTSADQEVCYSKVFGPLWFNLQAGPSVGKMVEYRNLVHTTDNNYQQAIRAWLGTGWIGPYKSINSVVMANGPEVVNSDITVTGGECHSVNGGDESIDPVTMTLKNNAGGTQYRDLYLHTRGPEIG